MRTPITPAALILAVLLSPTLLAADFAPDKEVIFKTAGEAKLRLYIFEPAGHQVTDRSPAIIFFFGGGWSSGTAKQFYEQARFCADRGMVAMSAEYRVSSRDRVTPFECVSDAKSAVRWVRGHAAPLGIDPNRIVASGGSAGGHIALCTGLIEGLEEPEEDLSIDSAPNAMILYNPVLDTTAKGYGLQKVGEARQEEISPCHQVRPGIAPTLVLHGTDDKTVPFENAERFTRLMKQAGNNCQLVAFQGKDHGFFNGLFFRNKLRDTTTYDQVMEKTVEFLTSLGYLENRKPNQQLAK